MTNYRDVYMHTHTYIFRQVIYIYIYIYIYLTIDYIGLPKNYNIQDLVNQTVVFLVFHKAWKQRTPASKNTSPR